MLLLRCGISMTGGVISGLAKTIILDGGRFSSSFSVRFSHRYVFPTTSPLRSGSLLAIHVAFPFGLKNFSGSFLKKVFSFVF
jgi:hypothetical protein